MVRTITLLLTATTLAVVACGDDDDTPTPTYSGEPSGRIAFTSDRDDNYDIYVVNADGSGEIRLTDDPAIDTQPAANSTADTIAFVSFRSGVSDIFTMPLDGSEEPMQVTNDPALESRPIWSPDDTQLAHYSAQDATKGFLWVIELDSGGAGPLLATLPSDGTAVCYGGTPSDWPQQDMLLYQGTQANIGATQACAVNPVDLSVRLLVGEEDTTVLDPVLSPDGSKIVYVLDTAGNLDIWVANVDGTDPARLTIDPSPDVTPVWSPDGQWIAFSSQRDRDYDIFIMRPDGSDVRAITDNDVEDSAPDWFN